MDNSHVALVSLHLKNDSFSEFRCDRDMTLGMNLTSLQKIIKCANNDDNCKLSANEDADTLNLQFQSKRAARIGEYEMKLMDIDSEQLGIPDTEYDAKIRMNSGAFAKIMRDLKDLGESVRLEATSEGIKFTAEGEIGTGSVTLKPTGSFEESDTSSSSKSKKKSARDVKPKVKKEGKVKMEENGGSDDEMDEDEEDVKPNVKDESESEKGSDDEEEEEDSEEEEEERPKKKAAAAKAKKSAKKTSDEEDAEGVYLTVNQSVSLNFSIKYLNNFAKSTPLSGKVALQMSNDVPLLVGYEWEGGSIKFYLAPKIAED